MREIKFRAWDKEENKFRKDSFMKTGDGGNDWIIFHKDHISTDEAMLKFNKPYFRGRFVLMQYTDLKDKNGKEIYEGDIIKAPFNGCSTHHKVYFDRGVFSLQFEPLRKWAEEDLEVVGNIYENPELIK